MTKRKNHGTLANKAQPAPLPSPHAKLDIGTIFTIFISALISVSLLLGSLVIGKAKTVQLQNIQQNLSFILSKTQQAIVHWKNEHTANMSLLASDPEFRALAQQQLAIHSISGNLFGENLQALRNYFYENVTIFGDDGFFIK